jgi:hypothetical protein
VAAGGGAAVGGGVVAGFWRRIGLVVFFGVGRGSGTATIGAASGELRDRITSSAMPATQTMRSAQTTSRA